ncbi:MAG: PAS domain-containing protein, partial [Gemmatimonadetes bacterium]|nr:PAS domain-containing protein [Gemmatimonadota bacterium]
MPGKKRVRRGPRGRGRAAKAPLSPGALWRSLVSCSPDYIMIVERDGRIRYINRTPDFAAKLLGRTIFDIAPQEEVAGAHVALERVFRTGEPEVHESSGTGPGGTTAWYESRMVPIRTKDRVVAVLICISEITARKQTEATLRESQERLRALFKGLPLPTYAWKKAGEDFVLVDYNDAGEVITHGKIASYLGIAASALYPDQPEIVADLARCFAERTSISREMTYRFRSTGEERPLAVTYGFAPPDGVVVHTEDITERKRAEQALQARERQQAAVAELGQQAFQGLALAALIDETVAAVTRTLDVKHCGLLERLSDGRLLLRAGTGWRQGLVGRAIVGWGTQSLAGYTLVQGEPVIVADLRAETRFSVPPLLREHGMVCAASVPISGEGSAFGVLEVCTTRPRVFTQDDVHFLQAVANVVATAIVRKREDELRHQLLKQRIFAQEEERRRIARELHDEAGQALTSLLVGLRTIQDAPSVSEAHAGAAALRQIAADVVDELGRLARGLHPTVLDDLGLVPAVARFAREHAQLYGIAVNVDTSHLGAERLPPAVETTLYRILQEAMTNVVKHAAAETVEIRLRREGSVAELIVRVDGEGMGLSAEPGEATPGRLGLLGIRVRADL